MAKSASARSRKNTATLVTMEPDWDIRNAAVLRSALAPTAPISTRAAPGRVDQLLPHTIERASAAVSERRLQPLRDVDHLAGEGVGEGHAGAMSRTDVESVATAAALSGADPQCEPRVSRINQHGDDAGPAEGNQERLNDQEDEIGQDDEGDPGQGDRHLLCIRRVHR